MANAYHFVLFDAVFGFLLTVGIENGSAFTAELYQRDSYGSPFYNASVSKTEIIQRAIVRSVHKRDTVTPNDAMADVLYHKYEYLMHIRLGTPPVDVYGVVDTGSELTWVQCKPFTRTFPQRTPLFDLEASSSYAKIPCSPSKDCPLLSHSQCLADGWCHYSINYADKTYSSGLLSTDTMRIESARGHQVEIVIPKFIFGCGINNGGSLAYSGIIGLGPRPVSFLSQLSPLSSQIFSYCFIRLDLQDKVGHIRFGRDANLCTSKTVVVPLVNKESRLYITTIEALTVGNIRIEFSGLSGTAEEGNTIIDSGSVVMEVPRHLYAQIRHAVLKQTRASPVPDPKKLLDLCFASSSSLLLPTTVVSFGWGDVPLQQYNVYVEYDTVTCLAIEANDRIDMHSVYGSMAQRDFIVAYDLKRRSVSFTPFDCTTF